MPHGEGWVWTWRRANDVTVGTGEAGMIRMVLFALGFLAITLTLLAEGLFAVSIPGEANTLSAEGTAAIAAEVGFDARISESVNSALAHISGVSPYARVVICGSLYLAGQVLRRNG